MAKYYILSEIYEICLGNKSTSENEIHCTIKPFIGDIYSVWMSSKECTRLAVLKG